MLRSLKFVTPAVLLLAAFGCAKPPAAEVDAARQAVDAAKAAEAETYAPEDLARVQDAMKRLDAELAAQEERFALMRSYDKAKEIATEVQTTSDQAKANAASAREAARAAATQSIADTRALVLEVQDMLAKAPTGKGAEADLAALKADLEGAGLALDEADRALQAGKFRDAETGANAAKMTVEQVRSEIEAAIAARESARKRRS
jgi:hypothetical protein